MSKIIKQLLAAVILIGGVIACKSTSQTPSPTANVAVGEWFAVVSADYARGEAVVQFASDSDSESVWTVYLVSSTELCGIVASGNGAMAFCRPKGGELRLVSAEKGEVLQLDPYRVEIVGNLTMKIGNLMPQTDGSKKFALTDTDVNRVATVKIYPGNKVTISYANTP